MAMRYQKATVLWTDHHDKPGSYEPSVDQLEDWDDELAEFYDLKLDQEMLAAGIPVTKATRSQIVALAEVSNGGGSARIRVRNACRFYANTWSLI